MDAKFVEELLKIIADNDACMEFSFTNEKGKLRFWMDCSDLFAHGIADCEEILPEDLFLLRKCFEEDLVYGGWLFCCRKRKRMPMSYVFEAHLYTEDLRKLFEECEDYDG